MHCFSTQAQAAAARHRQRRMARIGLAVYAAVLLVAIGSTLFALAG